MNDFTPMEYKIVKTITIAGMEKDVSKLLREGWRVSGGIAKSYGIYLQSLVR